MTEGAILELALEFQRVAGVVETNPVSRSW
jgi:hypothetical protein